MTARRTSSTSTSPTSAGRSTVPSVVVTPGLQTQADALGQSLRAGLQSSEDANGGAIVLRTQDVVTQLLDRDGHVLASTREAGGAPVVPRGVIRSAATRHVFTNVRVGGEREPYRVLAKPVSTKDGRRIVVVATSLEADQLRGARESTAACSSAARPRSSSQVSAAGCSRPPRCGRSSGCAEERPTSPSTIPALAYRSRRPMTRSRH